jgi:hypothetical protein
MNKTELAQALGVSYHTVLRWETGQRVIGHPRILALALDRLLDQRAGPWPPCEGSRRRAPSAVWRSLGSPLPDPDTAAAATHPPTGGSTRPRGMDGPARGG